MSEEHKDGQDVNDLKKEPEKVVEVEKKESPKVTPDKKKMNIPLVTISAIVLGGLSLFAGSAIGSMLGPQDTLENQTEISEGTTEEKDSTSETSEKPAQATSWEAPPLLDGEPKLAQEDVVDRKVAPWSDNYKQDDSKLDYLTDSEFKEKLNSDERFVAYIGRATCPYCHEYRQLQDVALGNIGETIFAVDTEYYRDNENITAIRAELGIEFVPDVVVIENGKVVESMPEEIQVSSPEKVQEWFESVLN